MKTKIKIDRTLRPTYPDWMKKVMHPELELTGPDQFDLGTLGLWLHDDQKTGVVTGSKIYDRLKKDDSLVDCLGLADLLAIQALGIETFRKFFAGKAVFGWKSVVQYQDGRLLAPFLFERDGEVVLRWYWLGDDWDSSIPALRFSKSSKLSPLESSPETLSTLTLEKRVEKLEKWVESMSNAFKKM